MAKGWAKFPYAEKKYVHTAATLKKAWGACTWATRSRCRRRRGARRLDRLPRRRLRAGGEAGLAAGGAGVTVANKATAIYANYLEADEKRKLALFEEVAGRAEKQQAAEPGNANAFYWQAYALGRYAQESRSPRRWRRAIGGKVKAALETAIRLAPKHADAHIALAAYHAEVIDKVGSMIGA